ncbi:thiamine-phosphate kinase [Methanobrevibacter filiformis]|uniref:Thiamine-monophosphate kinase n=1 Tax=Methanobrevibacter filiformis TaxID=55758 RepID=A0A162FDM3_9EURY|nr:thiamine-phosphate kinase [Methanobrevibacter filiformis]KZX11485.1 thiamine-monophosphate kinase [Methanobrevibacter filiformis]
MPNKQNVSDIGEKELINRIIQKNTNNYIGDDAAEIDLQTCLLMATSDMLLQSSHFPKMMSHFQMGWKAVTVNVSDLAAMGADPRGLLINIAIPKTLDLDDFDEIYEGIFKACDYYKIPLIGGDTNESKDEIIISGTALGTTSRVDGKHKHGFKKGDILFITGNIGYAAIGFEILKREENNNNNNNIKFPEDYDIFKSRALNPIARLEESKSLNATYISSATDITDGLGSELHEMLSWNDGGGFMIYEEKIPNINKIKKIAHELNLDYLDLLFHYGEDFELVFTLEPEELEWFTNPYVIKEKDFHIIGEVTDSGKVELTLENGKIIEISSKGYNHLN